MVSWDCPYCNSTGKQQVVVIRGDDVERVEEDCRDCGGKGHQHSWGE